MKILLVDDASDIRENLTLLLTNSGHTVLEAEDGLKAVKILEEQEIELVISDILMPAMDGLELVTYLRKNRPGLKIITTSGGGRLQGAGEAKVHYLNFSRSLGAHAILPKPFTFRQLLETIEKVRVMED